MKSEQKVVFEAGDIDQTKFSDEAKSFIRALLQKHNPCGNPNGPHITGCKDALKVANKLYVYPTLRVQYDLESVDYLHNIEELATVTEERLAGWKKKAQQIKDARAKVSPSLPPTVNNVLFFQPVNEEFVLPELSTVELEIPEIRKLSTNGKIWLSGRKATIYQKLYSVVVGIRNGDKFTDSNILGWSIHVADPEYKNCCLARDIFYYGAAPSALKNDIMVRRQEISKLRSEQLWFNDANITVEEHVALRNFYYRNRDKLVSAYNKYGSAKVAWSYLIDYADNGDLSQELDSAFVKIFGTQ